RNASGAYTGHGRLGIGVPTDSAVAPPEVGFCYHAATILARTRTHEAKVSRRRVVSTSARTSSSQLVRLNEQRTATERGGDGLTGLAPSPRNHDVRTLLRKADRARTPDAARRAGDDRDLVFESLHLRPPAAWLYEPPS